MDTLNKTRPAAQGIEAPQPTGGQTQSEQQKRLAADAVYAMMRLQTVVESKKTANVLMAKLINASLKNNIILVKELINDAIHDLIASKIFATFGFITYIYAENKNLGVEIDISLIDDVLQKFMQTGANPHIALPLELIHNNGKTWYKTPKTLKLEEPSRVNRKAFARESSID